MKKLIIALMAVCMTLSLISPIFAEEGKKENKGNAVLIDLKVDSEIKGKKIVMSPKVVVMSTKKATITIGGSKTTLNGKKVKSDKEMDEASKNFLMKIEVVPEIIPNTNPVLIKVNMTFHYSREGSVLTRTFEFTVEDGKDFTFKSADPENKEKVSITINASIYRGQFEKKGKTETKVETKKSVTKKSEK